MVSGKTMIPWMMGIACSLLMACSSTQKDYLDEMPVIAEKCMVFVLLMLFYVFQIMEI